MFQTNNNSFISFCEELEWEKKRHRKKRVTSYNMKREIKDKHVMSATNTRLYEISPKVK